MGKRAVIGGSGFAEVLRVADFVVERREVVETPYGAPSDALVVGYFAGGDAGAERWVVLPRHGEGHVIPPHRVNYRANIWALREFGVEEVVALAAVGGISAELVAGALALPEQLIDYTWGREHTFFNGAQEDSDGAVKHIDFTHPYSETLRQRIIAAAKRRGVGLRAGGVYAATQGPRLETAAEIDRLERDGADVVGMTGMPEAALARELGLEYASIAMVINAAAGRGGNDSDSFSAGNLEKYLAVCVKQVVGILKNL